tara:strand:- start:9 stop:389 length:381 start_codon:yes stop_codon:yes gene_type:complete
MSDELAIMNQLRIMKLKFDLAQEKKLNEQRLNNLGLQLDKTMFQNRRYIMENESLKELVDEGQIRGYLIDYEERDDGDPDNLEWAERVLTKDTKEARAKLEEWSWNIKQKISDQEYRDVMDILGKM